MIAIGIQIRSAFSRLLGTRFEEYVFKSVNHTDPERLRLSYSVGQLLCLFLTIPSTIALWYFHYNEERFAKDLANAEAKAALDSKQVENSVVNLSHNSSKKSANKTKGKKNVELAPSSAVYASSSTKTAAQKLLLLLQYREKERKSMIKMFRTSSFIGWIALFLLDVVLAVILEKTVPGTVMVSSFTSVLLHPVVTYLALMALTYREVAYGLDIWGWICSRSTPQDQSAASVQNQKLRFAPPGDAKSIENKNQNKSKDVVPGGSAALTTLEKESLVENKDSVKNESNFGLRSRKAKRNVPSYDNYDNDDDNDFDNDINALDESAISDEEDREDQESEEDGGEDDDAVSFRPGFLEDVMSLVSELQEEKKKAKKEL